MRRFHSRAGLKRIQRPKTPKTWSCFKGQRWEHRVSTLHTEKTASPPAGTLTSCPCQVMHIQSVGTCRGWVHITWAVGWQAGTETGPIFQCEGLRSEWGRKVSLIKHYKSLENHLHFSTRPSLPHPSHNHHLPSGAGVISVIRRWGLGTGAGHASFPRAGTSGRVKTIS